MRSKLSLFVPAAAAALLLCGCGGTFEQEYVSISDYVPAVQDNSLDEEKISVSTFSELKQVLLELVSAGETESKIIFDQAYEGDTTEDLASACWQVRTQDALCAYCVENIAYDVAQIVTYYEAKIYISYSEMAQDVDSIVHLQYSTGLEDIVTETVREGLTRLVVLIGRSSYSAEGMELLVSGIYRENPGIAPREPYVTVTLFSGTGMQRLYEINIRYGMSAQDREARMAELAAVEPFAELDTEDMDEAYRALSACEYLASNCQYVEDNQYNSIYSALVQNQAGSEGMALAYVELCKEVDIDCQIVYGQYNWQDYCWNIIQIDGEYYHVDPAFCAQNGLARGFLLADESMWGSYRWNTASYPACSGHLSYRSLIGPVVSQQVAPKLPDSFGADEEDPEVDTPDVEMPDESEAEEPLPEEGEVTNPEDNSE